MTYDDFKKLKPGMAIKRNNKYVLELEPNGLYIFIEENKTTTSFANTYIKCFNLNTKRIHQAVSIKCFELIE